MFLPISVVNPRKIGNDISSLNTQETIYVSGVIYDTEKSIYTVLNDYSHKFHLPSGRVNKDEPTDKALERIMTAKLGIKPTSYNEIGISKKLHNGNPTITTFYEIKDFTGDIKNLSETRNTKIGSTSFVDKRDSLLDFSVKINQGERNGNMKVKDGMQILREGSSFVELYYLLKYNECSHTIMNAQINREDIITNNTISDTVLGVNLKTGIYLAISPVKYDF